MRETIALIESMTAPRTRFTVVAFSLAQACASPGQNATATDAGGDAATPGSSSGGSSGGNASSGGASSGGASDGGRDANDPGAPRDGGQSESAAPLADSGASDGGDAMAGPGCSGLALCDDFESATDVPQRPPSSALWNLLGTAGCSGSGNPSAPVLYPIVIDTEHHNSGSRSAKVTGGDGCGPLMVNTSAFPKLTTGEVYGRFWVYLSDTSVMVHHAVLMALGLLGDGGAGFNVQDQNSYLELAAETQGGLPTSSLFWQTSDSNTLPNTDSTGAMTSTYLTSAAFTCIEFHASAGTNAIQVWINGTSVPGLTSPPAPPSSNPPKWALPSPFAPASFALGWQSFTSQPMTAWFDDVGLASSRIGCQ